MTQAAILTPEPLVADPPPGVVVTHRPCRDKTFVGSPSIARLDDGALVVSHDIFGSGTKEHQCATTLIHRSEDDGSTWAHIATIEGAFWSNLFVHDGALYLMGTTHHHGYLAIRRSDDGGLTWTQPEDANSGLITPYGQYHTAPMPMVTYRGRIWRTLEDATSSTVWGIRYNPLLVSAPIGADLLRRDSWTLTSMHRHDRSWLNGKFNGWLEGNIVVLPDGRLADILRVDHPRRGIAAIATLGDGGSTLQFDPEKDFIDFPGGATKFLIRQDPLSGDYWALANPAEPQHLGDDVVQSKLRNTLALLHSSDARHWEIRHLILHHPDHKVHAFQYPDWIFDGDDMVFVSRTCWPDEFGGAPNHHDANFLTFHRLERFRNLRPNKSLNQLFA